MEGSSGKDSGCADEGGDEQRSRERKMRLQSGWAWDEVHPYSRGGERNGF